MAVTGQGHWTLTVHVESHREGSTWVATCPALDVASHGRTKKESCKMLREALEGFFEDCLAHDTLWTVLEERGLMPSRTSAVVMERPVASKAEWLNIPVWVLPDAPAPQTSIG